MSSDRADSRGAVHAWARDVWAGGRRALRGGAGALTRPGRALALGTWLACAGCVEDEATQAATAAATPTSTVASNASDSSIPGRAHEPAAGGTARPTAEDILTVDLQSLLPVIREQVSAARAAAVATPTDPQRIGHLAMLFHVYELGDPALAAYQRARQLAPDAMRWAYLHGALLAQLGRRQEARSAFRTAHELQPGHPAAATRLATLLSESGEHAEARALYAQVIAAHPEFVEARLGFGRMLVEFEEPDAAIEQLQAALALSGDFGTAHYSLALAHQQLGHDDATAHHLERSQALADVHPPGRDELLRELHALALSDRPLVEEARRMIAAGNARAAVAPLQEALRRNPASLDALITLVGLHGIQGDLDSAREAFEAAAAIDDGIARLHYNLGLAHLAAHEPREAIRALRRAIELDPQLGDAHAQLGVAYQARGDMDAAAAAFRAALEVAPRHPLAARQVARQLLSSNQAREVVELLSPLVADESAMQPSLLRLLATAHNQLGDLDTALDQFVRARSAAQRSGQHSLRAAIQDDLSQLARQRLERGSSGADDG